MAPMMHVEPAHTGETKARSKQGTKSRGSLGCHVILPPCAAWLSRIHACHGQTNAQEGQVYGRPVPNTVCSTVWQAADSCSWEAWSASKAYPQPCRLCSLLGSERSSWSRYPAEPHPCRL